MARLTDPRRRKSVPPDVALARIAAVQHGIVSVGQALEAGLGARGVQHRVAAGRLHRLYRGAYAVGHAAVSIDGYRMAAVLACGPGTLLSRGSAAEAWGLLGGQTWPIEVMARRSGRAGPDGILLHTTRSSIERDADMVRAIPVTSVSRTLIDLAGVVAGGRLERALHEAEVLGALDLPDLVDALHRSNGRRGVGRLRRLIAEPSQGPQRSVLEDRFLRMCRRYGLVLPRLNVAVRAGGRMCEVDALWEPLRVVVELDGAAFHATRHAFDADRRRDAALVAEGYVVIRLTWQRVTREAAAVADELRRVLALRGGTD